MKEVLSGIIRHGLTAAGGALAAKGFSIDGTETEAIAGAIVTIIGVLWSIWSKRQKPAV